MDQHPLSLKLFRKQQSKTKKLSISLKRKRLHKENLKLFIEEGCFFDLEKISIKKPFFILPKKIKKKDFKKSGFLAEKGQILIEGLFFIICILSFLLAVQFFQSLARKEIQKERLTKQNIQKTKASWYKPVQKKE